jgi:hypothetical protein
VVGDVHGQRSPLLSDAVPASLPDMACEQLFTILTQKLDKSILVELKKPP